MAEKKEKRYVSDSAQLLAEWNWEKNLELKFDPRLLTVGSGKKVWWKCSNGHEWQATIDGRNSGRGCPYCSGNKVLKGYNDLQTINPNLAKEWNYEKNGNLKPENFTASSGQKVWWKCYEGHEWQATIANRNNGRNCPHCSGQIVSEGYNDLRTINPNLAKEWNYEKNGILKPECFTANSGQKVWWRCSQGHEWQAVIINRNQGKGCPYCAGKKVSKGDNDLQTANPTLANEWNYEKNGILKPEHFTAHSNKKVWWKCSKGHEWQAAIGDRSQGHTCPYCAGKKVLKGYNDLQTVSPALADEWNYEKNKGLTPTDVMPYSNIKVWWKCRKGHEWRAAINNRNIGNGCPFCNAERKTSFPEYALVYYLEKYALETIHLYKEKGYELDIYIPAKSIAIEYDGNLWHKNTKKKDLQKNIKCKKDGIKLYRIREGLPPLNDSSIDFVVERTQSDLPQILEELLSEIIGTTVDVDLKRDAIAIANLREYTEKEGSISVLNPEIAKEWNYEKNGNLKPEFFAANSNKKAWWKCSEGHEWQASIANRNKDHGCPYCSGRFAIKNENDLQTVNPTLAKEWNYERNNGLTPEDVLPNSGKKVWWVCNKGHAWQASIVNRNRGRGCPYCAGRKALKGYNDLQTINPILATEWNYEKNKGFTPEDVLPNSGKKVWWVCSEGHEWQATIINRNHGRRCPQCAGEKRKSTK